MKTLIYLITIIAVSSLLRAEENHEVIWETEKIGGINDVLVSPLGGIFYNVTGSTIQIRNVSDGTLIEYFIPNDMPNHITHISITDDGRYMAMSGDNPHIVIYDLLLEREVKRFTTNVFERVENGTHTKYKTKRWLSSSISPDGTKVTGVAEGDQATYSSCWVVIDIASEEELVKESRLGYDYLNPENSSNFWIKSEYTPDGNYIVSQLDWGGGQSGPDSIYIHDANTIDVYDVVLHSFHSSNNKLNIHPSESFFTYFNTERNRINSYNILTKKVTETNIRTDLFALVFLRYSDYVIYGFGFESQIYNTLSNKVIYKYTNPKVPKTTTLSDEFVLSTLDSRIYCMNIFLDETSINSEYEDEIAISPNPTNSSVNVSLECLNSNIDYSIYNSNSVLINQGVIENQSGSFAIDFSAYSVGIYFITFMCDNELKTYKIVKGS